LLVMLLHGCILVGSAHDHEYENDYHMIQDAGWECWDDGNFDDWYFWAETDWSYDIYHLQIMIYPWYTGESREYVVSGDSYGYFEAWVGYYSPQCGEPVDIEFIAIDENGLSETYVVFW
jgi:hypothetical protein